MTLALRIFTEPQQGASYDDAAGRGPGGRAARIRRLLPLRPLPPDGRRPAGPEALPGPTDSWVTLGGLARETTRIRLGTLVTSATFRLPGPLAIAVAQVDAMSGGRVEVGLGSGWFEEEHTAYGIPFPRSANGSTGSRSSWPSSPGCGPPRPASGSRYRALLPAEGLAGAAQAGPVAPPAGHRRRRGPLPDAGAGRPLRRRVQPALPPHDAFAGACDRVTGRLRGHRPRPGHHGLLRRPGAVLRPERGGVRRRAETSAGTPTNCARAASAARPARWPMCSEATPPTEPPACTSRSSTWTTSTTSDWSPRRSCQRSSDSVLTPSEIAGTDRWPQRQ